MIIAGRKNTGKKLVGKIVRGLKQGVAVEVAALTEHGINHINKAGQAVADELGYKIQADPRREEIKVNGKYRLATIITFMVVEEVQQREDPVKISNFESGEVSIETTPQEREDDADSEPDEQEDVEELVKALESFEETVQEAVSERIERERIEEEIKAVEAFAKILRNDLQEFALDEDTKFERYLEAEEKCEDVQKELEHAEQRLARLEAKKLALAERMGR